MSSWCLIHDGVFVLTQTQLGRYDVDSLEEGELTTCSRHKCKEQGGHGQLIRPKKDEWATRSHMRTVRGAGLEQ